MALARFSGSKAIGGPGELCRYNKKDTTIHAVKNRYLELGIDLDMTSEYRPWTADGDEALIDLFHLGYTVPKMCKEFSRFRWDIVGRLVMLALKGELNPEDWGRDAKGDLPEGLYDRPRVKVKKMDKPAVERVKPCKKCGGKLAYMWQEEPFKEWRECKCGYKIKAGEAG